jgi:hypothetical protein
MIISFRHKFVFTAVPKTGTHAVRRALREHLGPDDLEQVRLFVEKTFPIPELARIQHGHVTLQELQPHLPPEQFDRFFKFAFVRNPFDRFVSYCSFVTRNKGEFLDAPQRVMTYFAANPPWQHILFRPQHSFVTGADGALLADHVGRVETMQESYDEIAQRIGIPTAVLEKVNATKRRDYRDYYTPPLIEAVAALYARDLELFGYQF